MRDDTRLQIVQIAHLLTVILRDPAVPHRIRCEAGQLRRILRDHGVDEPRETGYTKDRQ